MFRSTSSTRQAYLRALLGGAACEGRDFYPLSESPVKHFGDFLSLPRPEGHLPPSFGFPQAERLVSLPRRVARGRFLDPLRDSVKKFREVRVSGSTHSNDGGAVFSRRGGVLSTPQAIFPAIPYQAPVKATPRRHRAAIAAAAGSARPASPARTWRRIAETRSQASSSTSLTTTYS